MNLSPFRLLKILFDLPRLDDRRFQMRSCRRGGFFLRFHWLRAGRRRLQVRLFQRGHNGLPCFLGKRIQELVTFSRFHLVDDRRNFSRLQRIKQNVGVEIWELSHKASRELRRQTAK